MFRKLLNIQLALVEHLARRAESEPHGCVGLVCQFDLLTKFIFLLRLSAFSILLESDLAALLLFLGDDDAQGVEIRLLQVVLMSELGLILSFAELDGHLGHAVARGS